MTSKAKSQAPYTYKPEACDVHDKAKLTEFRAKRSEWVALLDQDPLHSVSNQLTALVWQDAVFRLINQAWRLNETTKPTASMNSLIVEALTNGYVSGLVLGVSRLTDEKKETRTGDKNVVSLRRVFDDIKDHRALITREVFVCYDGLPYDTSAMLPKPGYSGTGYYRLPVGGSMDMVSMGLLQKHFDKLSGIAKEERSRNDLITDKAFDDIQALLCLPVVEKLRTLRNKVVAHAADQASRGSLTEFGFTLDEAEAALKALTQAYRRVQINLLWNCNGGVMPVPQFDIFEHMDQPFLRPDQIETLGTFWDQLVTEREEWPRASASVEGASKSPFSIPDQIDKMLS